MGKIYEVEGDILEKASNKPLDKERIINALKSQGSIHISLKI